MGNVCVVKDPDEDDYDKERDIDSTTINRDYFKKHPGINDKVRCRSYLKEESCCRVTIVKLY